MSTSASIVRTFSAGLDGLADPYDHAIDLVDSTEPRNDLEHSSTREQSPSGSWKKSAKNFSVRGQIARRKYAKWQQDSYNSTNDSPEQATNTPRLLSGSPSDGQADQLQRQSGFVDFATEARAESVSEAASQIARKGRKKKESHKKRQDAPYEIDILYENQRGGFLCGIPLYSHSSLLQFDPAPWVNKDYKPSAVNITNAQVPDPSWRWDWKHWYVDMSGDVDEDGWQYSFAFFGNFAWHGSHPWFHSHVRKRRWLRRRVKTSATQPGKTKPSSLSAAHKLNSDYFTIHSKRGRSPAKDAEDGPRTARPDSYISNKNHPALDTEMPEEINDIASLLKAIRVSTIDREKVDAVRKFIDSGDEELAYLKDHIPDIMQLFTFQNSKRQILEIVKGKANEAKKHREEHDAEERPEGETESKRIDNLLAAVKEVDQCIGNLEYYSDRQDVLQIHEDETFLRPPLAAIFDRPASSPDLRPSSTEKIKGIPSEAEVGVDANEEAVRRIGRGNQDVTQAENGDRNAKGKGREKLEEEDLADAITTTQR